MQLMYVLIIKCITVCFYVSMYGFVDRGPQRQAGNQAARQEKLGLSSKPWIHMVESIEIQELSMSMSQNPGTLGTLKKKWFIELG